MKHIKMMTFEQWRQFLRYGGYLNREGKEPKYVIVKKIRYMKVPAMDEKCNIIIECTCESKDQDAEYGIKIGFL